MMYISLKQSWLVEVPGVMKPLGIARDFTLDFTGAPLERSPVRSSEGLWGRTRRSGEASSQRPSVFQTASSLRKSPLTLRNLGNLLQLDDRIIKA